MFENDYLMHYGIKGQKWGVRRYQNSDGSLTTAGRARYSKSGNSRARYGSENPLDRRTRRKVEKLNKRIDAENAYYQRSHAGRQAIMDEKTGRSAVRAGLSNGIGAGLVGTGLGYAALSVADGNKKLSTKDKLKAAGSFGGTMGLAAGGGAAAGTVLGSTLAKHVVRKEGPTNKASERYIQNLVAKRNALDPSQKNRKGKTLTKEEYSKAYNQAMNELGSTRKHKGLVSDDQYNKYLRETVAYGSKRKNSDYQEDEEPRKSSRGRKVLKGAAAVAGTAALAAGGAYAYNRYKKNKNSTALAVVPSRNKRISNPKRLGLRDSYTMSYKDVDIIPPSNRPTKRNKNDRVINVSARQLRRMQRH